MNVLRLLDLLCSLAGEIRLEEVCLAERIGQGASSTVYRVSRRPGMPVLSNLSVTACQAHSKLTCHLEGIGHPAPHAVFISQCPLLAVQRRVSGMHVVLQGAWRGAPCAVKFMVCDTADEKALQQATREIVLSKRLSHPHVVSCRINSSSSSPCFYSCTCYML